MKIKILKITALSLFVAAMIAAPASVRAQDATTNAAPAVSEQPAPAASVQQPVPAVSEQPAPAVPVQPAPVKHKSRKHDYLVFRGTLTAVDTNAMTFTVGERTFEITSETRITKDGEPAILADGVVGEPVRGAYKKDSHGTLTATNIRYGAKSGGEKPEKEKPAPDSMDTSTNSAGN